MGEHTWQVWANCSGVDTSWLFAFENEAAAKALCDECPVRKACFEFALNMKAEGVWGAHRFLEGHPTRLLTGESETLDLGAILDVPVDGVA